VGNEQDLPESDLGGKEVVFKTDITNKEGWVTARLVGTIKK
jgi:hypothetical protein